MLLMGDGRMPVGGHTQSAGLEAAVMAGLGAGDVPAYLRARLASVSTVDAGTAVLAHRSLTGEIAVELVEVHRHWAARTPSQVQRKAAEQAALGYLRLLGRVTPGRVPSGLGDLPRPPRPIAVAAFGVAVGLTPRQVAEVLVHDEIQAVTSAALKLLPLDPSVCVDWALGAHRQAARVVDDVAGLTSPVDLPCPSAPMLDVWLHHHARSTKRLFSA